MTASAARPRKSTDSGRSAPEGNASPHRGTEPGRGPGPDGGSAVTRLFHGTFKSTIWPALLGALMLWASFPPLNLAPLAFVAPIPLVVLIRREQLPGRRPYRALWLAGTAFWLITLEWLRHAYWGAAVGGVALAMYLGVYLPLFVGLSRVAVWRLRIPLMLAAPCVWMGLELARAHLLTGFTLASLGHTQHAWLALIQVSDLSGAYAVGAVVMLVATALARMLPIEGRKACWWPAAVAAAVVGGTLGYGHLRMGEHASKPGPRIALIQGSVDTEVKIDPTMRDKVWREYMGLSTNAIRQYSDLDLIVWPETMFRDPLFTWRKNVSPPPGAEWSVENIQAQAENCRRLLSRVVSTLNTPVLVGIDILDFGTGDIAIYNAALQLDRSGKIIGRYDKMHPVVFGEYVPFGKQMPWLYRLTPLPQGIESGTRNEAFEINGAKASVNICYELFVPHLLRRQVLALRSEGREPQLLINLTNNGYYGGSAELDLHLISAVFRAVEARKPFLIAANAGFSASIDANGCVQNRGPRRATAVVLAEPQLDGRRSLYLDYGDWLPGIALAGCCLFAGIGAWDRWRTRRGRAHA